MKNIHTLLFASLAILAAAITTASCEKIDSSTSDEIQQKILDAWIRVNHPGLTASDNGIYTLSSTEGTGRLLDDSLYVFVKYSARTLDGTYTDYNYEDIAKQLGKFSYSTYYTYDIWYISASTLTDGLNEVLKKMKVGGEVEAAIPPAMLESNTTSYNSLYYYTTDSDSKTNVIYDIEVLGAVDDIYKYQIDCLEEYRDKNFPSLDSLSYGFYFKKTKTVDYSSNPSDTLTDDTSVNVWYVGRTLDGFVFDTNIEDTAKKYRFYSSSGTYTAKSVTWNTDYSTIASDNSLIDGFSKGLSLMERGEKATVFFYSGLGYGESGSSSTSSSLPGYLPLEFELYIAPKSTSD
jgi:FKBP-type peptidyl-prolyl cis-trans isomerase 2